MRLAYAFCANAADYTAEGKLCVVGGDIDTIRSRQFPATHPILSVVAKLIVEPAECGQKYEFQVQVIGPGGKALHPGFQIPFEPEFHPEHPQRSIGVTFIGNILVLEFPEPGEYGLRLLLGDEEVGHLPLYVEQLSSPETTLVPDATKTR